MRLSRSTRAGRFVVWKTTIFFLAAGIWLAGVITGRAWLTGVAIGLLVIGILLRFLAGRATAEPNDEEQEA